MFFTRWLIQADMQALEHYEDLNDIKRVVVHTQLFSADVSPFRTHDIL
jgi:hypothetical protein